MQYPADMTAEDIQAFEYDMQRFSEENLELTEINRMLNEMAETYDR